MHHGSQQEGHSLELQRSSKLQCCASQSHGTSGLKTYTACSELRLKDIERVSKHFEGVKALEKRGFTKEQKEELVICEKVLNWLQDGKDVRWAATG